MVIFIYSVISIIITLLYHATGRAYFEGVLWIVALFAAWSAVVEHPRMILWPSVATGVLLDLTGAGLLGFYTTILMSVLLWEYGAARRVLQFKDQRTWFAVAVFFMVYSVLLFMILCSVRWDACRIYVGSVDILFGTLRVLFCYGVGLLVFGMIERRVSAYRLQGDMKKYD